MFLAFRACTKLAADRQTEYVMINFENFGAHNQGFKTNPNNPEQQDDPQIPRPDLRFVGNTADQTKNGARAQHKHPQKKGFAIDTVRNFKQT